MKTNITIPENDIQVLRRLAERKAEIANSPRNLERQKAWYALNDGSADWRPMVWVNVEESMGEYLPDSNLECVHPWARQFELWFRTGQYVYEVLQDDHVIEASTFASWKIAQRNYGVTTQYRHADNQGHKDAWKAVPPLQDLDRDLPQLKNSTFSVDREATLAERELLEKVFGGILEVGIRGTPWRLLGMTYTVGELLGMEGLMMNMFDNPDGVHRLMKFLYDEHSAFIDWCEREGLLTLNNRNDYLGFGSTSYARDLPQRDGSPGSPVRAKDLWVALESQETVGVGPDLFEEFIFPYQRDMAKKFGKCFYGCCEPLDSRIHIIKRIPNLARVSVSPWANVEFMAQALGSHYVYVRKGHPTLLTSERFDEGALRADLRRTLEVTREHHCRLELALTDVLTVQGDPRRLQRWVEIAREEIDRLW